MIDNTNILAAMLDKHGVVDSSVRVTLRDGQLVVRGPGGGFVFADDGVAEVRITAAGVTVVSSTGKAFEVAAAARAGRAEASGAGRKVIESVASLFGWTR